MSGMVECFRGGRHLMPAGETKDGIGCMGCFIEDRFEEARKINPEIKDIKSFEAGWVALRDHQESVRQVAEHQRRENSLKTKIRRFFCLP